MQALLAVRVCSILATAAVLFVAFGASTAAGADSEPKHSWAWRVQQSSGPSLTAVDKVPEGDIAVGWAGQPNKISYVAMPVAAASGGPGTSLEATVDEGAGNVGVGTAEIQACLVVSPWAAGTGPIPWDRKPDTSCDTAARGKWQRDAAVLRFDGPALASLLAASSGAYGISLEPVAAASAPFDVVFAHTAFALNAAPSPAAAAQGETGVSGLPWGRADPVDAEEPALRGAAGLADAGGLRAPEEPPVDTFALPVPEVPPADAELVLTVTPAAGSPAGLTVVYGWLALLGLLPLLGRILPMSLRKARP